VIEEVEEKFRNVDDMVVGYYAECKEKDRLRVLNELQMCRALKEYTDVESTIAAVDKSFAEQMRKQIEKYSTSVKEALEDADDGDDENDDTLLRKIEQVCSRMRRERVTLDDAEVASHTHPYDDDRMEE